MSKQLFYDLETTGLNPGKNGIHQIAAIMVIDGVEKLRYNLKIQPNPNAVIEDDALKIAKVTREDLATYKPFAEGYNDFKAMLTKFCNPRDTTDKIQLIGYNNRSFDDQFLRGLFLQNGDKYFGSFFWADSSDVLVLASECLREERYRLTNFQLKTVASYVGIEVDEAGLHDALYDIELTMKIYQEIKTKYFK